MMSLFESKVGRFAIPVLLAVAGWATAQDRGAGGGDPLRSVLDRDGDGVISAQEMAAAAQSLAGLDRNGDGRLSADEIRPRDGGRRRAGDATARVRQAAGAAQQGPPVARDAEEKRVLAVLDDLFARRGGNMNVPREDGRLLRLLVQSTGAQRVVEVGTSNGYSAIWMSLGLRATGGRLITHELDPARAARARKNLERAGVAGLVTIVEGDAHETVKRLREPIDVLFLDADKAGYLDYLQKLQPLVRPGGLIIAHNMNRPRPDPKFLQAIRTDPELDTLFLNMQAAGLSVSIKKAAAAR